MIGSMSQRVTLVNPKRISNGRGGFSLNYDQGDRMEVWAAVEVVTVAKRYRLFQHDSNINMLFVIRANPFFKSDTRILFNGIAYTADSFGPVKDRPNFIEIPAAEV